MVVYRSVIEFEGKRSCRTRYEQAPIRAGNRDRNLLFPEIIGQSHYGGGSATLAARTVARNFSISSFSRWLSLDSSCADDSTSADAEPASSAPRLTSADVGCELRRALRGLLDVAGDLVGGGTLLLDCGGNRGCDLRHAGDRAADLPHRRDRTPASRSGFRRSARDLAGRLRGLSRQRLDLLRDHGEAAAGFARARRLDGGVQRQQVGLLGDGRDQLGDVADPLGRLRQFVDARVGALRLFDRFVGDAVGVRAPAGRSR